MIAPVHEQNITNSVVVFSSKGERYGVITLWAELIHLRLADPKVHVIMGRHPVAYLNDDDAWHTLYSTFRITDYMSDDYAFRVGRTWVMASAGDWILMTKTSVRSSSRYAATRLGGSSSA